MAVKPSAPPQTPGIPKKTPRKKYSFHPKPAFYAIVGCILLLVLVAVGFAIAENHAADKAVSRFAAYFENGEPLKASAFLKNGTVDYSPRVQEKISDRTDTYLNDKAKAYSEFVLSRNEKALTTLPEDYKGLASFGDRIAPFVTRSLSDMVNRYIAQEVTNGQAEAYIESWGLFPFAKAECKEQLAVVALYRDSRAHYENGRVAVAKSDYITAAEELSQVLPEDTPCYSDAQKMLSVNLEKLIPTVMDESERLYKGGMYKEASELISRAAAILPDNEQIASRAGDYAAVYQDFEDSLVPYAGTVEHLFLNPLIAHPSVCFGSETAADSLGSESLTPAEFTRVLEGLYGNNYVLISINELYAPDENDPNSVKQNTLMLPIGKKPLILSVNNVNYESARSGLGRIDKLVLDGSGNVAAYTRHADGQEETRYDNEIIPILDDFVQKHPDFSFRGAKGTLCLTGYEGILGYRTQSANADCEAEREQAAKVAKRLTDSGWTFACMSYSCSHLNSGLTDESLEKDIDQWLDEVSPLVGETAIFAYPFGEAIEPGTDKFHVLTDRGFRFFLGLGTTAYITTVDSGAAIVQDRCPLTGSSLINRPARYEKMFDCACVIDQIRMFNGGANDTIREHY